MARHRRKFSPVSLSFLDIMSCGFGAAILLFLIIKHQAETIPPQPQRDRSAEVALLEEEIKDAQENLVALRNTTAEVEQEMVTAQGRSRRVLDDLQRVEESTGKLDSSAKTDRIEQLKAELKRLDTQKRALEQRQKPRGTATRTFVGEGNRQYLTGLKLGGQRILILLDASASMLDETLVNVIRRRNMDPAAQRRSPKWQQAIGTVDWLSARFPVSSEYQIYTFNTDVQPVLSGTAGRWLKVSDAEQLDGAIRAVKEVLPRGGTSLEKVFAEIGRLSPRADNIYLITDGLPTQGLSPGGTTVSGKERLKLFDRALKKLPRGVPVNVILLPLEGDPMAASAFWQIAMATQGSFLTPSRDWP